MSTEVRDRLEARRILDEDLRKVIQAVNASRAGLFRHASTGRFLACHRPRKVTFWVEYEPSEYGGYVIHNAYCHRMVIEGMEKGEERP